MFTKKEEKMNREKASIFLYSSGMFSVYSVIVVVLERGGGQCN